MADAPGEQVQFLLNDFNTRLRDVDERNKLIRERVLLLGKNILSSRQESDDTLRELKRDIGELKREVEKLKRVSTTLLSEFGRFVKQDEVAVIERMLKDFQPLDFVRRKDIDSLVDARIDSFLSKKQIKSFGGSS